MMLTQVWTFINMKIINRFFDSHRVVIGPTLVGLYNNMIGKIYFYSNKDSIFIDDFTCVGIYDNGDIRIKDDFNKLLNYTSKHDEFIPYCIGLWNKEVLSKGRNELALSQGMQSEIVLDSC